MKYDFKTVIDRSATGSTKWDSVNADVNSVPLSMADMEFVTAPPIKKALKKLVDENVLGYTHETDEYYDAVISWQKRRHDFDVRREWIITTPGVVDALAVLIDAVTKPAESVLIMTPVYYPFDMAVIAKSRHIVYTELVDNGQGYEIDYDDLKEKCKRKDVTALLFCNPHNPVGRVWTEDELKKVGDICCDNGVFIIDDEIHNDLIMPGFKHTVMANVSKRIKDNIAVCTAPSKTFNIAGLQCSNIIIPNKKARTKAFACCLINMQMGLNIMAYTACIAAYNECEKWLDELIGVIDGNAKYVEGFMKENFPEVRCLPLEGTYLQWLDLRGLGMNHVEQKEMLEKQKIYLDNGEVFGYAGRGYQRINLACARETLEKTMARFKQGVEDVRAQWAENGKPVHEPFKVGQRLDGFVYTSPRGENISLADTIEKTTMIVFARFFECDVCQEILKTFKQIYPVLKIMGFDVKVVMQSDVRTLSKPQMSYPFELIADPECKFYDRYDIFEAHDMVQMIAGDKMFEEMVGKDVKGLLDTDLVASLTEVMAPSGEPSVHRENQLCALITVDKTMKIKYVHYSKTLSDFPSAKEMLKGLMA